MNPEYINGFSKLDTEQKIELLTDKNQLEQVKKLLRDFKINDPETQKIFESFSENSISNFHLPYGIAPNFLVDGSLFHVPMAVEESSVVAAASKSAKFWYDKGGFQTVFIKKIKSGQIHFTFDGGIDILQSHFEAIKESLLQSAKEITKRMEARGGGIREIKLIDKRDKLEDYYQLLITFDTADSMGANFINSCLEAMGVSLQEFMNSAPGLKDYSFEIIMAILSNYTPESIIRMKVETSLDNLNDIAPHTEGRAFAEKFQKAVEIARHDVFRATTHNKGIMNGIDAVVIATGNDFRAVEAAAHAYAARNGSYASLSECFIDKYTFRYELEIPLSLGTVGGLTSLHPLADFSIKFLDSPSAEQLMKITAAAGLANNFGAIRSLVTEGIQKGHMKLHLDNILLKFNASPIEKQRAKSYFADKKVSYANVKDFLDEQRS
ncbi:MAG: hydroxymethylglutaryl-CoA reductase, degradative [Bacteroidales bacterium]